MPRSALPQVALPPGRVRGKCLGAAWLHYQCSEKTLQQSLWVGGGQCPCCGSILDPQLEQRRSHGGALRLRSRRVCGMKLEDPGTKEAHCNPGWLIFSPPLLSPDAVRPWTCVCGRSPIAAAARGDAAQAAFHRKLSHYRNEIGEVRQQSSCVDGGRTSAPGCHSDAPVCSEITPSQVEA